MVDSLLRLTYSATDPVAATAAVRAALGSGEVWIDGRALRWEQVSLVDDGITVSSIQTEAEAARLAVPQAAELLVLAVHAGEVRLIVGDDSLVLRKHDLGLVPIGRRAELHWRRAHVDVFSIPPAPLARLLGVARNAVRLHAPRLDPASPALAEHFRHTARLLTARVFGTPEVYGRDLVRTHAIDALTAITVEAFELTNAGEDDTGQDAAVLRRALAHMRAHLVEPVSIPEVAHASGVSVRGLQMIFGRQLGVSPLLHLRQLRLEAAREELVRQASRGVTVAEIAHAYGYANTGRFSTHYRNEFGESPAVTLQRVRDHLVRERGRPDQVRGGGGSEAQAVESEAPRPAGGAHAEG